MWKSLGQDAASDITTAGDVALKYQDHKEIGPGAALGTQLAGNLDASWNAIAAKTDPNDPSIRQKFLQEQVQPALDQFKEGFSTENSQAWADHFTDQIYSHLSTKTAADQSTLAGIAQQRNAQTTLNNLAATVRADPSSADFAFQTLQHSADGIVGSSPTMDAVTSAKARSDFVQDGGRAIALSYYHGLAEKNPNAVQGILASGKYGTYLGPSDADQIVSFARVNARLNQSAADNARELQEHADKQAFDRTVIDLQLATLPKDTSQKPTLPPDYYDRLRQAGQMPGADIGHIQTLIGDGERIASRLNKPEPMATVSARNSMDIMTRMRATDDPHIDGEAAANKAYGDAEISASDRNMLVREWRDSKTADGETLAKTKSAFFDAVAPMIDKPLADIGDDSAKLRLYRFQTDVNRKVDEYRQAGKNPRDLFDPTKQDFPRQSRVHQSAPVSDQPAGQPGGCRKSAAGRQGICSACSAAACAIFINAAARRQHRRSPARERREPGPVDEAHRPWDCPAPGDVGARRSTGEPVT
jgi:hypothetical protein